MIVNTITIVLNVIKIMCTLMSCCNICVMQEIRLTSSDVQAHNCYDTLASYS